MKLSLERALKVGETGESEKGKVTLVSPVDTGQFVEFVNKQLPDGIRITTALVQVRPLG